MPIRTDEKMIVNGRIRQIGFSFKSDKKGTRRAVFRCDCGNATVVIVRKGTTETKSCGCLAAELSRSRERKHGHTAGSKNGKQKRSRTYRIWSGIRERCLAPGSANWHKYGARGISICDRWSSFENFLEDMGEAPEGLSIDRIDNEGNYEPSNCKWSTRIEQGRNKRNNRKITFNGEEKCLSEWEEELGPPSEILSGRLKAGWSAERALTQPIRKSNRNTK